MSRAPQTMTASNLPECDLPRSCGGRKTVIRASQERTHFCITSWRHLYDPSHARLPTNEELELFTSYVGRCVREAIEEACALRPSIKWVNDIYVCNRKLAGILAEMIRVQDNPCLIVGIGINGFMAPESLGDIQATCLSAHVKPRPRAYSCTYRKKDDECD